MHGRFLQSAKLSKEFLYVSVGHSKIQIGHQQFPTGLHAGTTPKAAVEKVMLPLVRKLLWPAVGRRSVPASAARRAAGEGRPVPHGTAAPTHSRGGLCSAAAASLRASPAAAPAPTAAASLAPVQLNDVVQRHVHFVGHGGRGIGLGSSPRVSTPARHFRRRAGPSGAAFSERPPIGCRQAEAAGVGAARAHWDAGFSGLCYQVPGRDRGSFCTFARGLRRCQLKAGGAARD